MDLLVFAFALSNMVLAISPNSEWESDYVKAQQSAVAKNRPLAVFVGTGRQETVVLEGTLSAELTSILGRGFVCVYLDTSDLAQRELIKRLGVTKGHGVVLSDRAGAYQVFHHDGRISETELVKRLRLASRPVEEPRATRVSRYAPSPAPSRSRAKPPPPLKKC